MVFQLLHFKMNLLPHSVQNLNFPIKQH